MNDFHVPVLLQEVINALSPQKGKNYIDATIGGGGHGFEILKIGGKVLGIDIDLDAIDYTARRWTIESRRLNINENNLILIQGNFRDIDTIARSHKFEIVGGIIFDLGVSSHQLEDPKRGFSFQKEAPLDMRMNVSTGSAQAVKAVELINGLTKGELHELFTKLGEERFAFAISNSIVRARRVKPIETTRELAEIVEKAVGRQFGKVHPATRVFQALRIAVNDELNNIRQALPKGLDLLESRGRIVAISFHSLEDRIVKESFKVFEDKGLGKIVTKKPITPSEDEIKRNVRSRSAKMRVFQKL